MGELFPDSSTDLAGDLESVDAGHLPVQDQDVEALSGIVGAYDLPNRVLAVLGTLGVNAQCVQGLGGILAHELVVVGNEYPQGRQRWVAGWVLLDVQGEVDHKSAAFALSAADRDTAAHHVHDPFGDGHAQAAALSLIHPAVALPCEGIEDVGHKRIGHAHAGVGKVITVDVRVRTGSVKSHQRIWRASIWGL